MKKICVGFVFGGKSSEHEISLLSAKNIIDSTDKNLFDIMLFGVSKEGIWNIYPIDCFLLDKNNPKKIRLSTCGIPIAFIPNKVNTMIINLSNQTTIAAPDLFFPIIHGNNGEDGSLQGFFNTLGVPFLGSNVLSSAVCMDKDFCKKLLENSGIKVTPFISITASDQIDYNEIVKKLGNSLFIKPSNQGSSIGISKVNNQHEFYQAIRYAFDYDKKILIETAIIGKEVECAVFGHSEDPTVSICGEVISNSNFYSYNAKYIDNISTTIIPAQLDVAQQNKIREIAKKAYQILECKDLARIDFFVTKNDIIVNEINTLPGFTDISMYPKLWESAGIGYTDLITLLIKLSANIN